VEAEVEERERLMTTSQAPLSTSATKKAVGSSFLDEWLEKRERLAALGPSPQSAAPDLRSGASDIYRADSANPKRRLPAPSPENWTEVIGPVARDSDVAAYLGLSMDELNMVSARGEVFLLETSDGIRAVPVAHFLDGRLVPGLAQVAVAVDKSPFTRWTQAAWIASPSAALGGKSPIEWLREGGDQNVVLSVAYAYSEEAW